MKWLVIGPQTRTIRAQEILSANGIPSQRRKLTDTGDGCVHALVVEDFVMPRAVELLRGAGIRIKESHHTQR